MEITSLIPHIEALIFASDKPLTSLDLTELLNSAFGFMEDKISLDQVEASLEGIQEKYQSEFYPFEVKQSGGGWQFLTKKDYHKTIAQLNGDKFLKRLSSAAMETLSIIAYKQPVTKGEIEAIRGVSSDYAVQKLLEKELIVITGRNETMPGHPLIYSTSKNFMDYFGINTAEDLPKIKEVLAEQHIEPTVMKDMVPGEEAAGDAVEADTISDAVDQVADATGDEDAAAFDTAAEAGEGYSQEEVDGENSGNIAVADDAGSDTADEDESDDTGSDEADEDESDDADATAEANNADLTEGASSEEDDTDTLNDDAADDGLLSVTETGELIGNVDDDEEEQS